VPQDNNTSHLGVSSMATSPLSENAFAGSLNQGPHANFPQECVSPRGERPEAKYLEAILDPIGPGLCKILHSPDPNGPESLR